MESVSFILQRTVFFSAIPVGFLKIKSTSDSSAQVMPIYCKYVVVFLKSVIFFRKLQNFLLH